ncbi:MAG TPA: DUF4097 family beta strand repeat-containing protein [Kofleriaceae bacterium]|nr:DUF4097 family beta strand repeat-containing protein [Kofleriaceae bacterium]
MRLVAAGLVVIVGSAPAIAQPGPGRDDDGEVVERAELTVGPSRRPISAVVIDNALGDVRVEGHDSDQVTIVSVKHAPDVDTLERLRVTLVPDPDGTVRLTTALGDGRERPPAALGALRIDLVIRVPRSARVDGRVGSGRLEVKNLDGGADLDAGGGNINVENVAGRIQSRSVDGDQHFTTVFGDLDAHAVDADLELDTIRGRSLTAQIHSGSIAARRVASRDVRLLAIDGDVRADVDTTSWRQTGSIVVSSLRGDIDVSVRATVRLKVRARAGGEVVLAGASTRGGNQRWVEGQFGQAGRPSQLGTVKLESRYGDVAFSVVNP